MNTSTRPIETSREEASLGWVEWLVQALALFVWALLSPSRWRAHLARVDASLRPDFGLVDLTPAAVRNPALRRLLLQIAAIGLVSMAAATVALLWVSGVTTAHIWLAAGYGAGLGLAGTVITGSALSFVGAAWGGVFIAAAFGLAGGLALDAAAGTGALAAALDRLDAATRVAGGLPAAVAPAPLAGIAISIAIGFAGYMVAAVRDDRHPLGRQAGATVIGLATCLLTHGGAVLLALLMADLTDRVSVVSVGFGAIVAGTTTVVFWLRGRSWRKAVKIGGALGAVQAAAVAAFFAPALPFLRIAVAGVPTAIFYSVLFVLAFALADRLGGRWAGAVASAIGSGTAFILFVVSTGDTSVWSAVPLSIAGNIVGLMVPLWLPAVLYPFEAAANLVLLHREEERAPDAPTLIYRNSVFWDELQWLPLSGLDDHLLRLGQRDPRGGLLALERVAITRQRWAAQAARLELDARTLEECAAIADIPATSERLAEGDLESPTGPILRTFLSISESIGVALRQGSLYDQQLHLVGTEKRLEDLVQDLTRSSLTSDRFLPIAGRWRQLVRDHRVAIRQVLDDRQEIPNPYVRGIPLTEEQDVFVGRGAISNHIAHVLLSQHKPALLLFGQRRMGKTSLLNRLGRLLPARIVPMFVDLQGIAGARTSDGFLFGLSRSMTESAMRHRHRRLPPLSRDRLRRDPFAAFAEWLDQVEADLGDSMGLLALDEFEALDAALRVQHLDERDVLGMLRHVIQHRRRLTVLLAGSHTLDEIQRWATYLINVQTIHLGYLESDEALQLVERPIEDFALKYEADASARVVRLTHGHPHLIQLLCYHVVGLKNAQPLDRRRVVTIADVEAAVPDALASGAILFFDMANQIGSAGVALLERLSEAGEGGITSTSSLARASADDRLEELLVHLSKRELIEPAQGGYRFQVELMRRWYASGRHRPLGTLAPRGPVASSDELKP